MLLPALLKQQLMLLKRLLLLLVKLLPLQYLSKFYFEILVLNKSHRKVAFLFVYKFVGEMATSLCLIS